MGLLDFGYLPQSPPWRYRRDRIGGADAGGRHRDLLKFGRLFCSGAEGQAPPKT